MKKIAALFIIAVTLGIVGFFGFKLFSKMYAEAFEINDWNGWATFKQDYLEDNHVDMKKYPYLYDKGFRSASMKTEINNGVSSNCLIISSNEYGAKTDSAYKTFTTCDDGTISLSTHSN